MNDFIEYNPMDVEHNVKAAVENLRKAYWSNETEKVAKHYTEAEGIIISAICHQPRYTLCKETTEPERPQGKWGRWVISEVQCPECLGWFNTDCYSSEELKSCPGCGAQMLKGGNNE